MAGAEIVLMPGSTASVEAVLHEALQKNDKGEVGSVIVLTFGPHGHFDVECSTMTFGDLSLAALLFQNWVVDQVHGYDDDPADDE